MSSVMATAKSLRISARKMGLVAALVRGRTLKDSLVILENTPKSAAKVMERVVKSAQANAENNHKLNSDQLVVGQVLVSPAGIIKRYRAGARGMVRPLRHRLSHVTVILDEAKPAAKQPTKTTRKAS